MTIAVDARELEGPPRGVARWLREVLGAWRASGDDSGVDLYLERELPTDFDRGAFRPRPIGRGPIAGATAWEQLTLRGALSRDRPAALLCPANGMPALSPVPTVVVIHDLSFEAHPEWFSWREGLRRRLLARVAARRAYKIVVVSSFTADEVASRYGVARDRLVVAANGISTGFQPRTDPARLADTRQRLALADDDEVVLSVGSMFTRRRPAELIAGFARLARDRPTARLVLVGDDRTHPPVDVRRLLSAAGLAERTLWLERISDDELVDLYNLAAVCVYVSDYEGFGLPPLEALACGAPVLASRTSALAANLAGRATLLEPDAHTPEAIAAALASLLESPPERPAERPAWLSEFAWPRAAAAVREALAGAAR